MRYFFFLRLNIEYSQLERYYQQYYHSKMVVTFLQNNQLSVWKIELFWIWLGNGMIKPTHKTCRSLI